MVNSTKSHIILGTESWLDSSFSSLEVFTDNFTVFRKGRYEVVNRNVFGPMADNSTHGGVFVGVSSDIICSAVPELDIDGELVWTKINISGSKPLHIGAFYRQPRTVADYLELINNSLNKLSNKDSMVILGGDFNLPDINWQQNQVNEGSSRPCLHQTMLDIATGHGLEQVVQAPTFEGNTLDLIFTNRPAFVNRVEVLPGICRHHAVLCKIASSPVHVKRKPRTIQIHKRANTTEMKADMEQFRYEFLSSDHTSQSTDSLWVIFKNAYLNVVNKHVPTKTITPRDNHLPWIDIRLRRLCNKRKKMFNNAINPTLKAAYRNFSKQVDKEIKKSYFRYLEELFTPNNDDKGWEKNKAWFNLLKSKRRENNGISPLKQNGRLYTDDLNKADILNQQFFSVFSKDDNSTFPDLGLSPHPTMPDIEF